MAFQNHQNHLYQYTVIEDGHKATEREKQKRLKQQQNTAWYLAHVKYQEEKRFNGNF